MCTTSLRNTVAAAAMLAAPTAGATQFENPPTLEGAVLHADVVLVGAPTGARLVEQRSYALYPGSADSPVLTREVALLEVELLEVLDGLDVAAPRIWVATELVLPRDLPVVLPLQYRSDPTRLGPAATSSEYCVMHDITMDGSSDAARHGARIFVTLLRAPQLAELPAERDPAQA